MSSERTALCRFQIWQLGYVPPGYSTIMVEAVIYITGMLLYAIRWPERWIPGIFDHVGSSHQLFHTCVVLGVLVHYYAALQLFEWRASLY